MGEEQTQDGDQGDNGLRIVGVTGCVGGGLTLLGGLRSCRCQNSTARPTSTRSETLYGSLVACEQTSIPVVSLIGIVVIYSDSD